MRVSKDCGIQLIDYTSTQMEHKGVKIELVVKTGEVAELYYSMVLANGSSAKLSSERNGDQSIIGQIFNIDNSACVSFSTIDTQSNSVPLALWNGCNASQTMSWDSPSTKTLKKTLKKSLKKYERKGLITPLGIDETTTTVGIHGAELTVNATLSGTLFCGPAAITLLMNRATISSGWKSQVCFAPFSVTGQHKDVMESMCSKDFTTPPAVGNRDELCRVLLYAGMLSALRTNNVQAAFTIGLHLPSSFSRDKNEKGCAHLYEFLEAIYSTIAPLGKPTVVVHTIQHELAEQYEAVGRYDAAIKYYKRAVNTIKSNMIMEQQKGRRANLSTTLNNLALCYKRNQNYQLAENAYVESLNSNPSDPNFIRLNLSTLHLMMMQSPKVGIATMSKIEQMQFVTKSRKNLRDIFLSNTPAELEPFMAEIHLCFKESMELASITNHHGLLEYFDEVIEEYPINKSTRMNLMISKNCIAYTNGDTLEVVGKWHKESKQLVAVACGNYGEETITSFENRFRTDHGIELDFNRDFNIGTQNRSLAFCEIHTLGRTWVFNQASGKIFELPRFPPSSTVDWGSINTTTVSSDSDATDFKFNVKAAKEGLRSHAKATSKKTERMCQNCAAYLSGNAKRCSRCRSQYYCGVTCQREAWPKHKKSCKKV